MPFVLPEFEENETGWGPVSTPEQFSDLPFAPFEKKAFVGRMADWSARAEQYRERRFRDQRTPAVTNEAFAFQEESQEGFSLVDTQKGPVQQPGWDKGMRGRGRGRGRGRFGVGRGWQPAAPMGAEAKFNAKFEKKVVKTVAQSKWKKSMAANNYNRWNDRAPVRLREASVDVRPEWTVMGQYAFTELNKMTTDVPEGVDVYTCGTLMPYDKAYDRINVKMERKLEKKDRAFYRVTTSDDPIIARLAGEEKHQDVKVFATDAIVSVIMSAPRSAMSWDIIVNKVDGRVFLDKRNGSPLDFVSCNETAVDFTSEDPDSINNMGQLVSEATMVNQYFTQQVLIDSSLPADADTEAPKPYSFAEPMTPFAADAPPDEVVAPVAYRYRAFDIGRPPKAGDNDTRVKMIVRTELDAVMKGKQNEEQLLRLFALNEVDSRLTNGIDWRQKLDSQRGAVLATELKNNSCKLAKWTLQSMLAGADSIKLGYVSRNHTRDSSNHVVLGTQTYKPNEFARQINLNANNAWGVLKSIIDVCLSLEEGRYLLLKDPNKPVIRLYTIPLDAFDEEEEKEEEDDDRD
jgi:translation initiation factor 3 subunit D